MYAREDGTWPFSTKRAYSILKATTASVKAAQAPTAMVNYTRAVRREATSIAYSTYSLSSVPMTTFYTMRIRTSALINYLPSSPLYDSGSLTVEEKLFLKRRSPISSLRMTGSQALQQQIKMFLRERPSYWQRVIPHATFFTCYTEKIFLSKPNPLLWA